MGVSSDGHIVVKSLSIKMFKAVRVKNNKNKESKTQVSTKMKRKIKYKTYPNSHDCRQDSSIYINFSFKLLNPLAFINIKHAFAVRFVNKSYAVCLW